MSNDPVDVAILFADICDSTPLYERSGDVEALAIIARCLDSLAATARQHAGHVVRSKGDDLLCTFEQAGAALDAATAMIGAFGQDSAAIRVGIHHGPVIPARDDIFGDAVNVAARILALANPGEAVTSHDFVSQLPPRDRLRMRLIGARGIKGKVDPIELYSMIDETTNDADPATQIVWTSRNDADAAVPETIAIDASVELEFAGRSIRIEPGQSCLIGRAGRCDVVIDSPSVSREHARIATFGGRVTITDHSSTGTWILDAERRPTTLRRDSAQLHGRGVLRLGLHPNAPGTAVELGYRVRHRS